jgi:hypothetical protein
MFDATSYSFDTSIPMSEEDVSDVMEMAYDTYVEMNGDDPEIFADEDENEDDWKPFDPANLDVEVSFAD